MQLVLHGVGLFEVGGQSSRALGLGLRVSTVCREGEQKLSGVCLILGGTLQFQDWGGGGRS